MSLNMPFCCNITVRTKHKSENFVAQNTSACHTLTKRICFLLLFSPQKEYSNRNTPYEVCLRMQKLLESAAISLQLNAEITNFGDLRRDLLPIPEEMLHRADNQQQHDQLVDNAQGAGIQLWMKLCKKKNKYELRYVSLDKSFAHLYYLNNLPCVV